MRGSTLRNNTIANTAAEKKSRKNAALFLNSSTLVCSLKEYPRRRLTHSRTLNFAEALTHRQYIFGTRDYAPPIAQQPDSQRPSASFQAEAVQAETGSVSANSITPSQSRYKVPSPYPRSSAAKPAPQP